MIKKLTPSLRFLSYTEPYKMLKLSDIADVKGGFAFDSKKFKVNGSLQVIKMSNVYNNILDLERSKSYIDSIIAKEQNSLLIKGDIIITLTGTVGKQDYGYLAIIDNQQNLYLNQRLAKIRPVQANPYYLYNNLFTKRFKSQFFFSSKGGTGNQSNVGTADLSNIGICVPSIEEQTKIATFLSAIDEKIERQQRLLTLWQAYKKGIMQQIFSQKLRFKAPNGEDFPKWETKTLGEIGSTYNGLSGKTKDDFGSGFPFITYKSVFDNSRVDTNRVEYVNVFISSNGVDKSERQNKVEYGDIFFTVSSETPNEVGMSSVLLDEIDNCYLNSFCFGYRLNDKVSFNPNFFQHYLRSSEMRKSISILGQGSTRYNISASNMMNLDITVPSIEEQTKIASFLSSLDGKIAHIQRQLTSFREFKKGLLQQMFV